jgi:hypothetical protein
VNPSRTVRWPAARPSLFRHTRPKPTAETRTPSAAARRPPCVVRTPACGRWLHWFDRHAPRRSSAPAGPLLADRCSS